MRQCGLVLALFAVGVFGLVGCGGNTNVPGDSKGEKLDNGPRVDAADGQPATSEAGDAKDIPVAEDPSLAVRRVLQGVQDGQAAAIWAFLPSRHQKEINSLVRNFADKMDAKIWNRTFVSLKRLVDIARTKKGLLINNPGLPLRELDQKQLDENWPALLELFDTLLTSELKDVKTLATFDGKSFSAGTGTQFLKQLLAISSNEQGDPLGQLADSKITVVDRTSDQAHLHIGEVQPIEGEATVPPSQFIVIDGQWFPSDLSAALEETLRLGNDSIAAMPAAGTDASRKKWLAVLDALDTSAAELEKADSPEAFNKALADAQLAVIPLLVAASTPSDEPRGSNVATSITVVLQGAIDEKARRDHIATLRILAKSDEVPDVTSSNDATTVILSTSQSIQTLVDGIKFGKVTRIDERKRTITGVPGQRQ